MEENGTEATEEILATFRMSFGDDPELSRRLKEIVVETDALGYRENASKQAGVVSRIGSAARNWFSSLVREAPQSSPETEEVRNNVVITAQNFKRTVERIRRKIPLEGQPFGFAELTYLNKDQRSAPDLEWFVEWGYTALELWPYLDDPAEQEGPGVHSLFKLRKCGLEGRMLFDKGFISVGVLRTFVDLYGVTPKRLKVQLNIESIDDLLDASPTVERLEVLGVTYEGMQTLWGMKTEHKKDFKFSRATWQRLGAPEPVKKKKVVAVAVETTRRVAAVERTVAQTPKPKPSPVKKKKAKKQAGIGRYSDEEEDEDRDRTQRKIPAPEVDLFS